MAWGFGTRSITRRPCRCKTAELEFGAPREGACRLDRGARSGPAPGLEPWPPWWNGAGAFPFLPDRL